MCGVVKKIERMTKSGEIRDAPLLKTESKHQKDGCDEGVRYATCD